MIDLRVRRLLTLALGCIAFLAGAASVKAAEGLAELRAKGSVVIGVKSDYAPWGFRDSFGRLRGMDVELGEDLARRIGVPANIVAVTSANRLELLRQGQVDIIVATLGDSANRRRQVHMVEPHYYASGIQLMMSGSADVHEWEDIRGATVCALQGTYFNKPIAERFALDLRIFKDSREAKLALRDRRCAGYLFDGSAIASDLLLPEWQGYATPLPALDETGWAIALRPGAAGGDLARLVSEAVIDWHRSGLLVRMEAKWNIRPTKFLADMHQAWSARDASGNFVCPTDPPYPLKCMPTDISLQAQPVEKTRGPLETWLRNNNVDLTILFDPYDSRQFRRGLLNTIGLALACLVLSVIIGLVGASLLAARNRLVRWLATAFVEFFRYTPPLVQLYFFFFGIGAMLPLMRSDTGLETPMLDGFSWAVIVLGIYAGASNAIIFRAGMDAITADIREAAISLGYGPFLTYWRILLPMALRRSISALNANLINIVKATGLAAAIAVPELLYVTNQIWPEQGNIITMMNVLLVSFFVLISVLVAVMNRIERRLRLPGRSP